MPERYTSKHIETWRQEGAVVVPLFFKEEEIKGIVTDFEEVFPAVSYTHLTLPTKA